MIHLVSIVLAVLGEGGQQQPLVFEKPLGERTVRYSYLLYHPPGYEAGGEKKWPLVVFLHGMGERGDDIHKVKIHGIPKLAETKKFPFVAASPQCPLTTDWRKETAGLNAFLDEILEKNAVDPDRVYLTGLSMGGYGTWMWACANPERFAAIVPICGGGDPSKAAVLKDLPVWAFHGAKDRAVPLKRSEEMVEAIRAAGGSPKLTVYPDAGHDSWTVTYENPEVYDWLLKQVRKKSVEK